MRNDREVGEQLKELVDRLQPIRPLKIVLFGSTARGTRDHLSDIDVIVVAEQVRERFLDRIAEAYDLIDPHYGLDILIYRPEEYATMRAEGNTLLEAAERDGVVLYERPAA